MPPKATLKEAESVEFVFQALGYGYLRASAVDDCVLIRNGAAAAIRLRKLSQQTWRVEMLMDGVWEKTPNKGSRGNMVAALCDLFNQQRERKRGR